MASANPIAATQPGGQTYTLQANYSQVEAINTTSFTGPGISGNPYGVSDYLTSTFITLDAQAVPEPSTTSLLLIAGVAVWLFRAVSKSRRKA